MQIPLVLIARKMGIRLYVCDGNPDAPGAGLADKFFHVDLRDIDGLLRCARDIRQQEGLHGVITVGTDFSASVAWIAEHCDLPGTGYETALNASRKDRMRKIFYAAGIPGPGFAELTEPEFHLLERRCSSLAFPLVAKPVDNMGARGVMEARDTGELKHAARHALEFSPQGKIVVEEKISGSEYSLDALIDEKEFFPLGIARRIIDYPPYFVERGHQFPSGLGENLEYRMFSVLRRGAESLGIVRGAVKGDIFLGADGQPLIGEIAVRLSGGYMSGWTYPLHSGVHPTIGAILLSLGFGLSETTAGTYLRYSDGLPSSERGLISIPGEVRNLPENIPDALFFPTVMPGSKVRFPRNNVEKCGNFIQNTPAEAVEKIIADSFLHLKSISVCQLRETLAADFPWAYPGLRSYLKQMSPKENAAPTDMFLLPDEAMSLPGEDWAFRSIEKSIEVIEKAVPQWKYERCYFPKSLADNKSAVFLKCLARGGAQAAVYFLDLYYSRAENKKKLVDELGDVS